MSMLRLENITKIIHNGSNEEKVLLDHIDFQVNAGDFVTVLRFRGVYQLLPVRFLSIIKKSRILVKN